MNTADLKALESAKRRLERPDIFMKSVDKMTDAASFFIDRLPGFIKKIFHGLGQWALKKALLVALTTLRTKNKKPSAPRFHKMATILTGAFGGILGFITLFFEIPLTTVIMLRGIADIARSEGEDLNNPETRLACLSVFAMDAPDPKDVKKQWRFFAARNVLQKMVADAAKAAGTRGAAAQSAPAVIRLVETIAGRFGITVSEKMFAQALPIIGAVGGASINGLLTHHYLSLAKGFFTMRRLEREYGETTIRQQFENLKITG